MRYFLTAMAARKLELNSVSGYALMAVLQPFPAWPAQGSDRPQTDLIKSLTLRCGL